MKKTYFIVCLLFVSFSIFGQKKISSIEIDLKTSGTSTFSVIDNEENINLFFFSKDITTYLKFDNQFKLLFKKKYPTPNKGFPELLGYSIGLEDNINLYFSNKNKDKFYITSYKTDGLMNVFKFDFKLKKETLLQTINFRNKFHILTFPKESSIIKRYTFENAKYNITSYDFSKERFYNRANSITKLSTILDKNKNEIIENNVPNSIEIASKRIKIYPKGESLTISLNHRISATRVILLDLNNDSAIVDHYNISTLPFENTSKKKSNSFIYQNRIYQMIVSQNLMVYTVKDLSTKKIISNYSFKKEEEIPFKNSSIIQDGSTYSSGTRKLGKTKQFLRKLTNSDNVGLVAYKKGDLINLHMGGIAKLHNGAGAGAMMMSGLGGIPIAQFGVLSISVNPLFHAYGSYNDNTRCVYIKCLFIEKTLEHFKGPVDRNIFDKIHNYSDSIERYELEVVFKYQDFFINGHYNKKTKQYHLLKFLE